ncbi:MAG: hypothetical protein ACI4JC_03910 [Faecalibacterium sp.]
MQWTSFLIILVVSGSMILLIESVKAFARHHLARLKKPKIPQQK